MLKSVILRYVARNVQSIVDFMTSLDTHLDAYLEKHDAEVAAFESKIAGINKLASNAIEKTFAGNDKKIAKLHDKVDKIINAESSKVEIITKVADEAIEQVEAKKAASIKSAEVARALKASLPSAKAAEVAVQPEPAENAEPVSA